jgi:hypothetical protein
MNNNCEHGVKVVDGLNIYMKCLLINSPCSHYWYCVPKKEINFTEGAKSCMGRVKKDIKEEVAVAVDEESQAEENSEDEVVVKEEKKEEIKKEFAIVTLVSKTKVFYDYNGRSMYKNGKFDVKVGDRIEI